MGCRVRTILETARGMEAAIRAGGAVPATIAVLGGKLVVGVSAGELAFLAESKDVAKVSRADLASVVASGRAGATTVATTALDCGAGGDSGVCDGRDWGRASGR